MSEFVCVCVCVCVCVDYPKFLQDVQDTGYIYMHNHILKEIKQRNNHHQETKGRESRYNTCATGTIIDIA